MLKKEETLENAEEWLPNAARAELLSDHCHFETNSKCIYNHPTELPKKSETKILLQHRPMIECLKTAKGLCKSVNMFSHFWKIMTQGHHYKERPKYLAEP